MYTNNGTPGSPPQPSSASPETVHVDIHMDPSGKDIVLWEDVLVAFKDAVNIRYGTRVVPFLKDASFRTYVVQWSWIANGPLIMTTSRAVPY